MGPQQQLCLSEVNMEIKQYLHNDAAHAFFFLSSSAKVVLV